MSEKRIMSCLYMIVFSFMIIPGIAFTSTIFQDDFDDGTLIPPWNISFTGAATNNTWTYSEQSADTWLTVTNIGRAYFTSNNNSDLTQVLLTTTLPQSLNNFSLSFSIAWDTFGRNDAMQLVQLRLTDILSCRYYDAWVRNNGYVSVNDAGATYSTASGYQGSALFHVTRTDGEIEVSIDGIPVFTTVNTIPLSSLTLSFGVYNYSGASGTATFGTEKVDYIIIESDEYVAEYPIPEPISIFLLGTSLVSCVFYKKRGFITHNQ